MREPLSNQEKENAIKTLDGWRFADDKTSIKKTFNFNSFVEAMAFMNAAAVVAEKIDHHPNWLNAYNRVEVLLTTHSANDLTKLDVDMANAMNAIANNT